jgi:choline-sulfatase
VGQDVAGKHPYHKLTALGVRKMSTPGRYADGNGLYLVVDSSGAKRWMQRLIVQGKRRDLGLGSVSPLVDIMPTLLDLAVDGRFSDYAGEIDGQSLVQALHGDVSNMHDLVVSEFAADGSTGPSRMIKKGSLKYMDLEGVDKLLFDLSSDPHELNNLIGSPTYAKQVAQLRELCESDWDREKMYKTIAADQRRRLKVHKATGGEPTYVNVVRNDDANRYIRNAGAADTKARARLPYVAPAKPDKRLN